MTKEALELSLSPNCRKAKGTRAVTCIILHATATTGIESPKEWLCNPESGVSAHYLIGKDGRTIQLVPENDIAWHAGESEFGGHKGVNAFSIGIELVNANDGKDPYPIPQVERCARLVASICLKHGIACGAVVGHKDIAPGRKTDPAGFSFDEFRMRLSDLGVASKKSEG